jgi:hypothetical protein
MAVGSRVLVEVEVVAGGGGRVHICDFLCVAQLHHPSTLRLT